MMVMNGPAGDGRTELTNLGPFRSPGLRPGAERQPPSRSAISVVARFRALAAAIESEDSRTWRAM